MLQHLRSLSAKKIARNSLMFKDWDVANPLPYVPVPDGEWASKPFCPKYD